ncbi:hypothetical protein Pth03_11540 [Planotetraspora thailandica]|uniref:Uncharacterized protein n=1 Tax=Planotetraspora thailandica TaxID=487172 RepID=A0A8J3UY40_9ACTN|nr:hypothetical protein [Planotetraspora thailandica]GII52765.1 hypothetical protein Pth03_11540 [Planotetraspora thailandica]
MNTIALSLLAQDVAVERQGIGLLLVGVGAGEARDLLEKMAAGPPPDAGELARLVPDKRVEKDDGYLGESLLSLAYAARSLDVAAAWRALRELPR